jgi:hypothetical protein
MDSTHNTAAQHISGLQTHLSQSLKKINLMDFFKIFKLQRLRLFQLQEFSNPEK